MRIDVERERTPPSQLPIARRANHREAILHQPAVRHDHQLTAAGLDGGVAPAHIGDASADIIDPHPVAHAQRVVQLQRHPAQHVAERVLHRKRHDRGDDGGRGEQLGRIDPGQPQPDQAPGHGQAGDRQILRDAWRAESQRRQQAAEHQRRRNLDGGQPADHERAAERAGRDRRRGTGQRRDRAGGQGQRQQGPGHAQRAALPGAQHTKRERTGSDTGQRPQQLLLVGRGAVQKIHLRPCRGASPSAASIRSQRWRSTSMRENSLSSEATMCQGATSVDVRSTMSPTARS